MGLVGVQEAAVLSWYEGLEGELAARGTRLAACKYLSVEDDTLTERECVVLDTVKLSNADSLEILTTCDVFNLFHNALSFFCC